LKLGDVSGGSWPLLFAGESVLPAWINLSFDLLTKGPSLGSLVTPFAHLVSHRDEKRTKGPENPIAGNIIGVNNKPTRLRHCHDEIQPLKFRLQPSVSPKNDRMAKRATVEWLAAPGVKKKNLFFKKKNHEKMYF
jgi:hypothetical protein